MAKGRARQEGAARTRLFDLVSEQEDPFLPLSEADIEAALIDAHWRYGALIHQTSAEALTAALGSEPSDAATGHTLFSRLFGEYVGSLETFAAWGWSLRKRSQPGSFLKEYLSYQPGVVKEFYSLVRQHEGDVSDLLCLPSRERIIEAVVAQHEEVPHDERENLSLEGYGDTLDALYERLKTTAEFYFAKDGIPVATFNKTKHGVPMLQLFEPQNPRTFEFVMKNPCSAVEGEPPFRFASFTVTPAEVDKYLNNVRVMTQAICELAVITKVVHDAGLLYDQL